jgi:LuxR family maltose regulon positive regulatory protein
MTGRVAPLVVQRGRFDSAFFRSKFRRPNAPDHFVRRTRLVELLDDLSSYPVTALVAPAGSGKTALVADWVHGCGLASGWLTLDESDRDPAQLCAALISAVATLAPSVADRAMAVVSSPDGPMGALRVLTEDLEVAEGDEAVLVVDDLHRVDDSPAAQSVLAAFVENKPDALHLVLLGRRRPALPMDRLRATGRLADVTFDVLRFSEEEALEMLAGLCPDTAPRDLPEVAGWSGGWAAALQLAALALRSQRAGQLEVHEGRNTFPAGSERLVDSYLWHEVLRTERAELVELLLSTAVVDRMNYGLADALTGRSDAGDLLLEAEARGLFVTSFDPGGWYEVHGLVREMLLAELDRRSPEQLRTQHARAAQWFESMDDGVAALGHWLDAGQPAEALRLLTATSMSLFESGRVAAIDRTIGRIPPQVAGADAASLVRFAWCRLLVDRTGFLDALAAAEAAVVQQGARDEAGRLGVLRAVSAWLSGDWQVCVDLALAGLVELGDQAPADPIGRFGWSLVVRGVALGERWSDLGEILERGRAAATHDTDRRLAYEAARAVGLALSGQPIDSLQVAAGVRHMAELAEMGTLRVELDIAEAIAARELGDRERAEPALEALAARSAYPNSYVRVLATATSPPRSRCSTRSRSSPGVNSTVPTVAGGWRGPGCCSPSVRTTSLPPSTGPSEPRTLSGGRSARRESISLPGGTKTPSRLCTEQNRDVPGTGSCGSSCWPARSRTSTARRQPSPWRPLSTWRPRRECSRRSPPTVRPWWSSSSWPPGGRRPPGLIVCGAPCRPTWDAVLRRRGSSRA